MMRFAYADPPYLGCGKYYLRRHPDALIWDDPETHRALIARLCDEYPDGWTMSLGSVQMHTILPMCPADVRICAWVKPFAFFKPGVAPAYAWEPVILRGGRKRTRQDDTPRDWLAANVNQQGSLIGAKPRRFARWLFELLNARPGDTFDDMFPGTHAIGAAWADWVGERSPLPLLPLETSAA